MSFDYLHGARSEFFGRLLEVRLPEHLCAPALLLAAVTLAFVAVWGVEIRRLGDAQRAEALYRREYNDSVRALRRLDVYGERVKSLVEFDRRVRGIAASGERNAVYLAGIAGALPFHAWLTSISCDRTGTTLEGGARDFAAVGAILKDIGPKTPGGAALMHAARVAEPGAGGVTYAVRIGPVPQ